MPDPKPKRSGSEKRRASTQIWARCTPEQKAAIETIAQRSGFESAGALFLHTLLNIPMPRASRRPKVEVEAIVKLLATIADLKSEAGKHGSNLNQIAHALNMGRPPARMMNLIEEAVTAVNAFYEGDMAELRLECLKALGKERDHEKPPPPP